MMTDMTNWKDADPAEGYIPHEDGKIKWYVMSFEDDGGFYIGEYDMTDWDKTFEEVFEKAEEIADRRLASSDWEMVRKDQLVDAMYNISNALHESGDFKKDWIGLDWWDDWNEGEEE